MLFLGIGYYLPVQASGSRPFSNILVCDQLCPSPHFGVYSKIRIPWQMVQSSQIQS